MSLNMIFLASCILAVSFLALLTDGYAIHLPGSGSNSQLDDDSTVDVETTIETEYELPSGSGAGSFKRSVRSTDVTNSSATFEDRIGCSTNYTSTAGSTVDIPAYASVERPADEMENNDHNVRGLCPWTYVDHIDKNRIPEIMQNAQCACRSCVQPGGHIFTTEGSGCHQIMYEVQVLRKDSCHNGTQTYKRVFEEVPVACACMRSKM